jgi:hypothetical protein
MNGELKPMLPFLKNYKSKEVPTNLESNTSKKEEVLECNLSGKKCLRTRNEKSLMRGSLKTVGLNPTVISLSLKLKKIL